MHSYIIGEIVKTKNYILCIFFMILIGIGMLAIYLTKRYDEENIVKTNATAVTSKVIVIDAGHGKPDEGAVGIYGTTEQAINLKIALKLQSLLEQSGSIVYLTRSDENGIYTTDAKTIRQKKISDVKNRVAISNGADVELVVSIHLNKFPEEKYSGWQTFYQKKNEDSIRLATLIQNSLNNSIGIENDRVPLGIEGVYLMDKIENTAVIVECGFLSNREEAKLLEEDSYQNKLAWGIYIGIQEYFK